MKEQIEKEIKKSKKWMFIGIIVIIVGAVLIISPIKSLKARADEVARIEAEYDQAMDEYEQAYDEWSDSWWNGGGASFDDAPDMPIMEYRPNVPVGAVLLLMLSIVSIIVGASMIFIGNTGNFYKKALDSDGNLLGKVEEMISDTHTMVMDNVKASAKPKKKKTKCENCGATKKGDTCEYCGQ